MSFNRLALEIRLQIWELSQREPQIIELNVESPHKKHITPSNCKGSPKIAARPTPIPTLLGICQESRAYGMKVYHKFFGGYVNFDVDTLLILPNLFQWLGWNVYFRAPIPQFQATPAFSQIQHVAFYIPISSYGHEMEPVGHGIRNITRGPEFSSQLRTVTFAFDDKITPLIKTISFHALSYHYHDDTISPQPRLKVKTLLFEERRLTPCRHSSNLYSCRVCAINRYIYWGSYMFQYA
jgi:hypothetical protein